MKDNYVNKKTEDITKKNEELFNDYVKNINVNFNDAYYNMKKVLMLINESFVINGKPLKNDKINSILGSIK